jgi:hypothetical protein
MRNFTWHILVNHQRGVIRIAKFLHLLPYLGVAYIFGWGATVFWGSPFSPTLGGWLCSGGVALFCARDWWKEWRRGY